MNEKLPAPCEHCAATGIFRGIECQECSGKGYRLIIDGRQQPMRVAPRRPQYRSPRGGVKKV